MEPKKSQEEQPTETNWEEIPEQTHQMDSSLGDDEGYIGDEDNQPLGEY